jgi:hypothetical protein
MSNLPILISVDDIQDLEIPNVLEGSNFMRRTYIECISNVNHEEEFTVGCIYKIEEVEPNDMLSVMNDNGNYSEVPTTMFRSITHGPFMVLDDVVFNSSVGATNISTTEGQDPLSYRPNDYVGATYRVVKAYEHVSHIQLKAGWIISVPNSNLMFKKRNAKSNNNPFKVGDKVKCFRENSRLSFGVMYTVSHVENDYVYISERDGDRFKYSIFKLYDKPSKKQLKIKKFKARMQLADHVRYYLNRKFDTKPTVVVLRNHMIKDKIIGEDITVKDIKAIYDTMFGW